MQKDFTERDARWAADSDESCCAAALARVMLLGCPRQRDRGGIQPLPDREVSPVAPRTKRTTFMNTKIDSETPAPRKLEKPVREEQEMKREDLVTYVNETGGFDPPPGGGGGIDTDD
jgi:hypothetical protein